MMDQSGGENHNFTDDVKEEFYGGFNLKYDIYAIIFGLLIIAVNSLVHVLMIKAKNLRNTANFMLCSLALSDLLTGLVGIPLFLACNIIRSNPVCIIAENVMRFTSISTVLHLLTITADRYMAIIHSLRYYLIVTTKRAYITLSLIWLFSIATSFIQLIWNNPEQYDVHGEGNMEAEIPYDIANIVLFFALPLIVMICLNSRIFYEVVRQSNIMRQNGAPGSDGTRNNRREWKAAVIFSFMFVTYCFCWLPYFIVRLQHNIGNSFFELPHDLEYVFIYLRFVSSLVNPLLYVLGKNDFRKALKRARSPKKRKSRRDTSMITKYSFLLKTSSV